MKNPRPIALALALVLAGTLGCSRGSRDAATVAADSARVDSIARARQDSINRAQPGYIVDSILPLDVELRRFRAVIGPEVTQLAGGSPSRDALVQRFVAALEKGDSADLSRMLLTAQEFGWLVYPESPFTRPPYQQAPGLVWSSIRRSSDKGAIRLLRRNASEPLHYKSYHCTAAPEVQGRNTLWTGCLIEHTDARGKTVRVRLFGSIIERAGTFKFVSYTNEY